MATVDIPQPEKEKESIKDQFKGGPEQASQTLKEPTPQELADYKDRMLKVYKQELPFLRAKDEYETLVHKQLERDVMMGNRPANTVPGILGLELILREVELKTQFANWKHSYEQNEERVKKEAEHKEATEEKHVD